MARLPGLCALGRRRSDFGSRNQRLIADAISANTLKERWGRTQNLELFSQIADGVDDETWQYHLRRHDFSRWFQQAIKDESLAAEASEIEAQSDLASRDSRAQIRAAIQRRYTTPP